MDTNTTTPATATVALNVNVSGLTFEHKSGFDYVVTPARVAAIIEKSALYVVMYGVRQSLADSMAGAKTEDEADAAFGKRLRKLLDGSMDVREVTRSTDPVKTETRRLANADLDKWVKEGMAAPSKERRKLIIADLMGDEMRIATARENVEREAARLAKAAAIPDSVKALLGIPVEPVGAEPEAPKAKAPAKRK